MKTIKRITVLGGTVALAGMLFTPSAFAAAGPSYGDTTVGRAGGTVGGGDHGLGNCGFNNGAGKTGGPALAPTPGLGGYAKLTCPPPAPTLPTAVEQQTVTEPVVVVVPPSSVDITIDQDFFI